MAATVAHKAFYCTYLDLAGVLTRTEGQVLFLESESGAVISLSDVEVYRDVVVNGPVELAMAAYLDDMARGGAVRIATSRKRGCANRAPPSPFTRPWCRPKPRPARPSMWPCMSGSVRPQRWSKTAKCFRPARASGRWTVVAGQAWRTARMVRASAMISTSTSRAGASTNWPCSWPSAP